MPKRPEKPNREGREPPLEVKITHLRNRHAHLLRLERAASWAEAAEIEAERRAVELDLIRHESLLAEAESTAA